MEKKEVPRKDMATNVKATTTVKATTDAAPVTQTIVVPPDGGWGWVIVGVGFLGCILVDGVSLSFATLQPHLIQSLNMSAFSIPWILSSFNCLMYLLGPVTSALANRFGFRVLMFIGSLLYCGGFVLSFFVNSYALLIICYSVVAGIGGSFIYMVFMACPGYWFEEKRSIAFGIVSASSGFSCIGMPVGSEYVSKTFGWRYVYFLLAGLGVIGWLSSFLLKKPPVAVVEMAPSDFKMEAEFSLSRNVPMTMSLATIGPQSKVDRKLRQISTHTGIQIQPRRISRASIYEIEKPTGFKEFWLKMTGQYNKQYVDRPMYKKDIFFQSRTSIIMKKYNLHPAEYTLSVQKMTTMKDIHQQLSGACTCCPEAIKRPLKEMLDFTLLKNITFVLIVIDTFLYYFSCYLPYVYIIKACHDKGINERTSVLAISLFGIGISASRLCIGFVLILLPKLSPTYLSAGSITVAAVLMFAMAFTLNEIAILILAALSGIFSGPWVPLRSVLLVQYLGLEKLTSAMGFLFVIQALGCLLGIPVAEFIIDYFEEIYCNYYITAILWVLVGVILAPLDLVNAKKQHKLEGSALYKK